MLLVDQAQSEAAFALAKFSLVGVASPLIIYELPLLLGHQIWITFGPTKTRDHFVVIILRCCGLDHSQTITDDPFIAVVDI